MWWCVIVARVCVCVGGGVLQKNASLVGSTMGSPRDYAAMLALVEKHRIVPVVHAVVPMHRFQDAFRFLEDSSQVRSRVACGSWELGRGCGPPIQVGSSRPRRGNCCGWLDRW